MYDIHLNTKIRQAFQIQVTLKSYLIFEITISNFCLMVVSTENTD